MWRLQGMAAASLAIEAVWVPVVAVVAGLWVDARFGTTPWGLVLGAAVGATGCGVAIAALVRQRKDDESGPLE